MAQPVGEKSASVVIRPAHYPGDVEIRIHSDAAAAVTSASTGAAGGSTGGCKEAAYQAKIVLRHALYGAATALALSGLADPESTRNADTAVGIGYVFLIASAFLGIGTLFMTHATMPARRGSNSVSEATPPSVSEPPAQVAAHSAAPSRVLVQPHLSNGRTVLDIRTTPAIASPMLSAANQPVASGSNGRERGMSLAGICIGVGAALFGTTAVRANTDTANAGLLLMVGAMVMHGMRRL